MTIISFIFHITRDLLFMPEQSKGIIKVPGEVINKGYESHPRCNFARMQVLCPKEHKKREYKKSKSMPPKIVVVVVLITGGTPWDGRTPLKRAPDRVLMAL